MEQITPISQIRSKAEELLRLAGGDREAAFKTLQRWIESDQALRQAVVRQTVREELEQAARRLEVLPRCPFCRGEIAADALKCQHCGEWLNRTEFDPRRPVGLRVWYFMLFTGLLLALLVAALIYSLVL